MNNLRRKQRKFNLITFTSIILIIQRCCIQIAAEAPGDANVGKGLSFCLKQPSTSNTLKNFWLNAEDDNCDLDPYSLIELYKKLQIQITKSSKAEIDDRCGLLMFHDIRKKLIKSVSKQMEEAFISKTFKSDNELNLLIIQLNLLDKRICQKAIATAMDELYLFSDRQEILQDLMEIQHAELQLIVVEYLLRNANNAAEDSPEFLAILTNFVAKLFKGDMKNRSAQLWNKLPKELRQLYKARAVSSSVGLLNYGQSEYLYAPRDNGPDSERRLPLTWSKEKNTTDSDGHFKIKVNENNGLIAFGSAFGNSLKYLYADIEQHAPFFWIGPAAKSSQWWSILWPHSGGSCKYQNNAQNYLLIQNFETKDLLCATTEYDENRRYVTLLSVRDNLENPDCFWLIQEF